MRQWAVSNPLQLILWAVIVLAIWHPSWGQPQGIWQPASLTSVAVSFMFFIHGLTLSSETLWTGIKDWRIHVIIQLCTFAIFPAFGALIFIATGSTLIEPIRIGFFILCATSSTIASSVALTTQARGRSEIAIFNASLSSLLGIFLTPFFASLIAQQQDHDLTGQHAIMQVVWHLLFPFAAGQFLRQLIGSDRSWFKPLGSFVDYLSISLTVFVALCDSINQGAMTVTSITQLIGIAAIALLLFITISTTIWLIFKLFKIAPSNQPAILFCGSQKSIANGVPIAKIVFANTPALGVMILPLVVYHQIQLLLSAFLADYLAKRHAHLTNERHLT